VTDVALCAAALELLAGATRTEVISADPGSAASMWLRHVECAFAVEPGFVKYVQELIVDGGLQVREPVLGKGRAAIPRVGHGDARVDVHERVHGLGPIPLGLHFFGGRRGLGVDGYSGHHGVSAVAHGLGADVHARDEETGRASSIGRALEDE
jgi:hypothetical protein